MERGQYVKIRGIASWYGFITRVNEKSFTIMCGNSMTYRMDKVCSPDGSYKGLQGDKYVSCRIITEKAEIERAKHFLD